MQRLSDNRDRDMLRDRSVIRSRIESLRDNYRSRIIEFENHEDNNEVLTNEMVDRLKALRDSLSNQTMNSSRRSSNRIATSSSSTHTIHAPRNSTYNTANSEMVRGANNNNSTPNITNTDVTTPIQSRTQSLRLTSSRDIIPHEQEPLVANITLNSGVKQRYLVNTDPVNNIQNNIRSLQDQYRHNTQPILQELEQTLIEQTEFRERSDLDTQELQQEFDEHVAAIATNNEVIRDAVDEMSRDPGFFHTFIEWIRSSLGLDITMATVITFGGGMAVGAGVIYMLFRYRILNNDTRTNLITNNNNNNALPPNPAENNLLNRFRSMNLNLSFFNRTTVIAPSIDTGHTPSRTRRVLTLLNPFNNITNPFRRRVIISYFDELV